MCYQQSAQKPAMKMLQSKAMKQTANMQSENTEHKTKKSKEQHIDHSSALGISEREEQTCAPEQESLQNVRAQPAGSALLSAR